MIDCFRDLKLHIFDLDDTLINTKHSCATAQTTAFDNVFPNFDETKRKFCLELIYWLCQRFGSGCPEQYFEAFVQYSNLFAGDKHKILDSLIKSYHLAFFEEIQPMEKVVDYLETLRSSNRKLAIVSNGSVASQEKKIVLTRLDDYFPKRARFISESFPSTLRKPSPYMILLACRKMEIEESNTVYYGNVVNDMVAGNLAGVTTVLVGFSKSIESTRYKIAKSDFTLNHWEDAVL